MFPRSVIDEMARNAGATLTIYPIHDNQGQFRRHFTYMMQAYRGLAPEDLPPWAAKLWIGLIATRIHRRCWSTWLWKVALSLQSRKPARRSNHVFLTGAVPLFKPPGASRISACAIRSVVGTCGSMLT
jgi:hypothetical protein